MNLNYAIFRSGPIMTTHDLAQIGSHNQREKQAYNSNPDIRVEDSFKNIELVPLNSKYVKGFKELTKEYEKQHNEKQKTGSYVHGSAVRYFGCVADGGLHKKDEIHRWCLSTNTAFGAGCSDTGL